MNVLVASVAFPPARRIGGSTVSIWAHCLGLALAGASVRVLTTNSDLETPVRVPRERVERGIPITTFPVFHAGGRWTSRFAFAPGLASAVKREIRAAEICIVQGLWTYPLLVASRACRRGGTPYVIVAQCALEQISLAEKAWKKRPYLALIERRAIDRASAVLFHSEREREASRRALGRTRAIVVPNAVEFPERVAQGRDSLRDALGLPQGVRLLGMAGRIHPRKGFDVIVRALARCDERLHLVAFGTDEAGHLGEVQQLAASLGVRGRLHAVGHLEGSELQRAYAGVDLLVSPSRGESFGLVLVEALAQGTEVLVSDRVALADYVQRHELGGVVRGLEPAAWSEALGRWLARERVFDAARAAHRVREDFDPRSVGERLLDELIRLTGVRLGRK